MKTLTLMLALVALALAGCGGDDEEKAASTSTPAATETATEDTGGASASGGGETIKLSADKGALKFDKSELTAKPGKVTLEMANPSGLPHAIAIEGEGVDVDGETVNQGGTSKASADLKAGTYEFYCPVGSHRQAGMEGKLTVK